MSLHLNKVISESYSYVYTIRLDLKLLLIGLLNEIVQVSA